MNALAYIGALESILFIGGIIYAATLWADGILPALLRLGNGLAKRKIALFAKGDNASSLRPFCLSLLPACELELCRHLPFGQRNRGCAPGRVAVILMSKRVGPGVAGRDR